MLDLNVQMVMPRFQFIMLKNWMRIVQEPIFILNLPLWIHWWMNSKIKESNLMSFLRINGGYGEKRDYEILMATSLFYTTQVKIVKILRGELRRVWRIIISIGIYHGFPCTEIATLRLDIKRLYWRVG